jgi:hypothetical protein
MGGIFARYDGRVRIFTGFRFKMPEIPVIHDDFIPDFSN